MGDRAPIAVSAQAHTFKEKPEVADKKARADALAIPAKGALLS